MNEIGTIGESTERNQCFTTEYSADNAAVFVLDRKCDPAESQRPEDSRGARVECCKMNVGNIALICWHHRNDHAKCGNEREDPAGDSRDKSHLDSFAVERQHLLSEQNANQIRTGSTVGLDVDVLIVGIHY